MKSKEQEVIKVDCKIYYSCRNWHHCWQCGNNETIKRLDNHQQYEKPMKD